jgi:hypothetical protein
LAALRNRYFQTSGANNIDVVFNASEDNHRPVASTQITSDDLHRARRIERAALRRRGAALDQLTDG